MKGDLGMDRSDCWLHRALRRHLGRVAAPDELWDRVMLPQVQSLGPRNWRGVWVLAAASALAVSVFAATWGYVPRLGSGKARMEFQSANGSDIRTWIRNRTGLDIPLLRKPDASIEMIGA